MANSKRRCRLKSCRKYDKPENMILVPAGAFCNFGCLWDYAKQNGAKAEKVLDLARKKDDKIFSQRKKEAYFAPRKALWSKLENPPVKRLGGSPFHRETSIQPARRDKPRLDSGH